MTALFQNLFSNLFVNNKSSFPTYQSSRLSQSDVRVSPRLDTTLIWVIFTLLNFGAVMVYSASIAMPDNPRFGSLTGTYFIYRHALFIFLACIVSVFAFQIPLSLWEKIAPWLFVISLLLLVAVLIPHVGRVVNGARRWIPLGFISFQPSEFVKFAMLLYVSDYMVRKMEIKERFFVAVIPIGIAVLVVGLLLLAEPDMGAFMVIAVIAMGILFLGGVNARMFFLIATLIVFAFSGRRSSN